MPSTTPIAALRYAVQTDTAVAQTLAQNLAEDLDNKLIPVYATTAARDAAITSPSQGMFCYVTSTASGGRTLMGYSGSAWVPYFRPPLFAVKSADESVTSSAVLQNDDHLVLAVEANTNYALTMWLMHSGATAGDMSYAFTFPASTSLYHGFIAPATNIASAGTATDITIPGVTEDASSPSVTLFWGTTPLSTGIGNTTLIHGYLTVGATAGNLQFQWAQNASSGTATVLHKGSWMRLERVL